MRNGIATIVALMASAALVAMAIVMVSFTQIESRGTNTYFCYKKIFRSAENTANVALAEAQARLGPDAIFDFIGTDGQLVSAGSSGRWDLRGTYDDGPIRCSWDVVDLSHSHDTAAKYVASTQGSIWAKTSAGRAKMPHALSEPISPSQQVALAIGGRELFGLAPSPGTAWQVRGLLTDSVHGGWRKNLSDPVTLTAELGKPLADLLSSTPFGVNAVKGYPQVYVKDAGRTISTMPVLRDFRLSLGLFNSRSDGRHRLRFHGSLVLWNPLTVPVIAGSQGKMFLVEVVGAPEVTVTNLETGSTFEVDLDDCPQGDFGIIRQGLRERGLWFWAEVSDPATLGMSTRGLLPGEVYALVSPSPDSQPQGLARILTFLTWRMDRTKHGPGWKRKDPEVFLPSDTIEIVVRFRDKVGIRLRPYVGDPARDESIADYPSKSVVTLDNISFPDFRIRITGEDYSRDDSAGYVIGERRACLRVRRRPESGGEHFQDDSVFRRSWDFDVEAEAAEWVVDHPLLSALDVVDYDASPLAGRFWDLKANRHEVATIGSFASIRLRDLPTVPWLSVGTLRHLEPSSSKEWTARLDTAFFAAPLSVPEVGVISHNPFLTLVGPLSGLSSSDAAKVLQVVGPFNVNSRDPKAWEAFLRDSVGKWKPDAGGPFEPQELSGPLFFTRPGGASLAKGGALSEVDVADVAVAKLPTLAANGLAEQQAVRMVDEAKLSELARRIVESQPSSGWPYPSLQAFAQSGILQRALETANIDKSFLTTPIALPVRLRAEDLIEAWAPVLTVRGDTFRVTGRAEGQGGSCVCEMIIQRVAEEHPMKHLGRRFKVISVRFRNY